MNTKTYTPRESEIDRRWYVVDAADETLGRLASRVARVLEGKHKPTYAAHLVNDDVVPTLSELPSGLAAGKPAADDVNSVRSR